MRKISETQIDLFANENYYSNCGELDIGFFLQTDISTEQIIRFNNYDLSKYIDDIDVYGLSRLWDMICCYMLLGNSSSIFLNIERFGELYEIGLAVKDKTQKKKSGQYYTTDDVALVLSKWMDKCNGKNVCDVACGTGKLILTFLNYIGQKRAIDLIKQGRIYLYDFDFTALKICVVSIIVKYKVDNYKLIHAFCGDFLNNDIKLPEDAKVISNPPYASISEVGINWNLTKNVIKTSELYAAFMEKIFIQAESTVIITPFSFISGKKFIYLRKIMCELGGGYIVSFDNVPGNIFCGRKHGIFNTNTANSVRAAITVLEKNSKTKGFRVSPLIRFKNEERNLVLDTNYLESILPNSYQVIDNNCLVFKKIFRDFTDIFDTWISKSEYLMKDVVTKDTGKFMIDMPSTCRYFTTACHRKLKRAGSFVFYFSDEDIYYFMYCFINSSFTYWWWRIFDGGIVYPSSLLLDMPIPYNLLSPADKTFFRSVGKKMICNEEKYVVTKVNAGVEQENIKFPSEYRRAINERILNILQCTCCDASFMLVHANNAKGILYE